MNRPRRTTLTDARAAPALTGRRGRGAGADAPVGLDRSASGGPVRGGVNGAGEVSSGIHAEVGADVDAEAGGVVEAAALVRRRWEEVEEFSPATLDKCGDLIERFARRLQAQGVADPSAIGEQHCRGFINAVTMKGQQPELTTRHSRRSALRMFFKTLRELGYEMGDPTIDISLPSRSDQAARPLSDLEITLSRTSSRLGEAGSRSLHRSVCWALAETTAVTSEISAIRVGDVDDSRAPRWVRLSGTRRHDSRLGELSEWGSTIIGRQLELLAQRRCTPATLLTYRGQGVPGQPGAQSAVCNAIAAVLDLSGLAAEPDVRPASVRAWAGRRLYDAGMPLEQVARRMGARSLDTVAADIALRWRPAP